jgi:hypothetical protein
LTHSRPKETAISIRRVFSPRLFFFAEESPEILPADSEQGANFHAVARENTPSEFREGTRENPPEPRFRLVIRGMSRENRSVPPPGALLSVDGFSKGTGVRLPGIPASRLFDEPSRNEPGSQAPG